MTTGKNSKTFLTHPLHGHHAVNPQLISLNLEEFQISRFASGLSDKIL